MVSQSGLTPATPWTVACRPPLCVEFSRQEYWNGLPFPSPGDLPDPGIEPSLLHCSQRASERALDGARGEKMGKAQGSEGGQRRLATGHWVQSVGRPAAVRQTGPGPAPIEEPCTALPCSLRDAPEAPRCAVANPGQSWPAPDARAHWGRGEGARPPRSLGPTLQ